MKKFWKKYKSWISGLLALAVFVLTFLFVIKPLIGKIAANADEIQKKNIDKELDQARIAQIPEMQKNHESFRQKRANLDVIITQDKEVDFIKNLETLADETENKISLQIEEAKNSKPASGSGDSSGKSDSGKDKKDPEDIRANLPSSSYLILHISLDGSYANFVSFLHRLENFGYYVNILSINLLKAAKEKTSQPAAGGNIFYSASEPKNAAKPEQAVEKETLKSTIDIAVYIQK